MRRPAHAVSDGPSRARGASRHRDLPRGRWLGRLVAELGLLAASALLFALCFPSFLSRWGWFPLAFVALAPMFWVVHRAGWGRVVLYGAFYGYLSYAICNYWLGSFHPLTLVIVPPIYAAYLLAVFPLLKAADSLYPRYGFMVQSLIWVAYEFLKVQGFLAYSYGILGYSQYLFLPLARLASLTGVWGVSLLVVLPSAWLGSALREGPAGLPRFFRRSRTAVLGLAALFAAALSYGALSQVDLSQAPRLRVALVQQNIDPWKGGYNAYQKTLRVLTRLSDQALREKPQIVIWSETSFVPAIDWHTRYRTDREAYALVRELREYLAGQQVPFVVGNDDGQLARDRSGRDVRVDYNAAILFDRGEILQTYRKIHLVPFTEHFPFQDLLPGVYNWLRAADTHFWEQGTEHTVFEAAGTRFSTPICFEDTFGYLCRSFIRRGAQMLVNMTNDSWSRAVACEMQHMSIALFRALENRRPMVRSTNGGITCVIDPNGRILARLEPFVEGYLVAEVPMHSASRTLYTRWGDWFGALCLAAASLLLVFGLLRQHLRGRQGGGLTRGGAQGRMAGKRAGGQ